MEIIEKQVEKVIDKAFTAGINYTDRKTCKAIYGEVCLLQLIEKYKQNLETAKQLRQQDNQGFGTYSRQRR